MIAAKFRYVVRLSGAALLLDVCDTAAHAAASAIALAAHHNLPIEAVRGDATGDKTRICQAWPDGHIQWFVPAGSA